MSHMKNIVAAEKCRSPFAKRLKNEKRISPAVVQELPAVLMEELLTVLSLV
jgi:hypothetical protein